VTQQILVGIDGSDRSRDALVWARNQALAVGGTLRVLYAWSPPMVANLSVPPLVDYSPLREQAEAFPTAFVDKVLGDEPGVAITTTVVVGDAAAALVDASRHADLLVIGSRGLGGLKSVLLGSVSHHCAAHAHCPTVIVRKADKHDVRRAAVAGQTSAG
jgi:nucleotide-binding universal stress UspA family protein